MLEYSRSVECRSVPQRVTLICSSRAVNRPKSVPSQMFHSSFSATQIIQLKILVNNLNININLCSLFNTLLRQGKGVPWIDPLYMPYVAPFHFRVQLKCDGTRWRREWKWRGNWRMEWVASTLHTTSEHGVSSITRADAHTSAACSRLNWRPCPFKWTRPFRRKTKSVFCACAITFQTRSTHFC